MVVGFCTARGTCSALTATLSPLRLFLRFGRAVQKLDRTLWMNTRQRINGIMADWTAFLIRINDRGVAIRGKNHGHLVCEHADGSFGELAQAVLIERGRRHWRNQLLRDR